MKAYRTLLIGAMGAVAACRFRPIETRIVVVTAMSAAIVALQSVSVEPTRTPVMDSAEILVPR